MEKKQFKSIDSKSHGQIGKYEYISSALYEEKKSKFYSYIFDINNVDEANNILSEVRKNFKDARHVVYAYVLENEYYCSDDGEPSGTGGKAIFSLLEKQKVINTLVIVIRYFGGILLGVGPLSRAYLKAVKIAEEKLEVVPYEQKVTIKIKCEYNEEPILRNLLEKVKANIIKVEYDEKVNYIVSVNEGEKEQFDEYRSC